MKIIIPFALCIATIIDMLLYRGEHVAAILHPIGEFFGGVRSAGNMWGVA